jgi:hypothetical protein
MLHGNPVSASLRVISGWAQSTEDRQVLQELADSGLAGLRRASPARFLRTVRSWLREGRERPRLLALLALRAAAQDPEYSDLPGLLRATEGVVAAVRGESRRALRTLIEALARRSPAEAASFVLQEFADRPQPMSALLQQCLAAFPERQRSLLQERLSAYRQAGIMRPG